MEYTVKGIAELAGVSPRTLRWYDKTGLLKPTRVNEAGYRFYGAAAVDRLQQILFFGNWAFHSPRSSASSTARTSAKRRRCRATFLH